MGARRTKELNAGVEQLLKLARVENVAELARWLGVNVNTARNWNDRGVPPDQQAKAIALAATRFGVNERIVSAIEARSGSSSGSVFFRTGHGSDERRFAVVPRFDVSVSAGHGASYQQDDQVGEFAFEIGWMRRNLGRAGEGFASVVVRGDSMQPTLLNGDEIIIDRQVLRVDVNGIYVISVRGDLLVKRVQRMLDGRLVVRSDNSAYAPEELTAERAEDFRVVGRMVWPRVR